MSSTPSEIAQILVALATLVSAFTGLVIGIRNTRKIQEVHIATNSMKDELVETTKLAAHAAGMADEKAAETKRKRK